MAGSDPKTAPDSTLVALGRELAGLGRAADAPPHEAALPGADPGGFELALGELIGDANGEVVVFNDSNLRSLTLRTDAAVVAEGRAAPHVTAAGADVTGCRFVTFAGGLTLYVPAGLELVVQPAR
jgi:hypothetical protein